MPEHTAMAAPFDLVRFSLQDLWKLDKTHCNKMLQSYKGTAASTEPMTVMALAFTVVVLMLLAFTILWSGLVRKFFSHQTVNFEPVLRILLRISFILFLPALSSVFSLTKAQGGTGFLLTLLWLLLVELIRMKVQAMMLPADGSSFSRSAGRFTVMDHADEVGHMVWAGYLVFFNMEGHKPHKSEKEWASAMRAMFVILWLLSFFKLMQRIVNTWVVSRSWYTGRNPLLIAAYMQHVTEKEQKHGHSIAPAASTSTSPDAIMEMCEFVVEGEHMLVPEKKTKSGTAVRRKVVTTIDYSYGVGRCPPGQNHLKHVSLQLDLPNDDKMMTSKLVTVGKVWQWGKQQNGDRQISILFSGRRGVYLQDLCLSFSLFKLLRRHFEQYPMVEVSSDMARRVMLEGLLNLRDHGPEVDSANRPFRVLRLELDFLERYYQAADRVAVSSHQFFISNLVLSILFVPIYLIAIWAILVTTKDADYFYCMALVSRDRLENFPFLAFSVTLALLATLICFEAHDFFTTYFNNKWNLVRLVCYYGTLALDRRLSRNSLYYMFRFRYWKSPVTRYFLKSPVTKYLPWGRAYDDIRINQVSITHACGPIDKLSMCIKEETLSTKAKEGIIDAMKQLIDVETHTISLPPQVGAGRDPSTGMTVKTSTEIILASHLATELLDVEHLKKEKKKRQEEDNGCSARVMATTLSRYCMYLVAHMPELLPDDEVWVSERFKDMRTCLANVVQNCSSGCMLCMPAKRCKDTMLDSLKRKLDDLDMTTRDAVELFDKMEGWSWNQLADFWVQLVIYLAPSNDVQGHAKAVVTSGGDLITCLWAFCTHAGITRQPQQLHGHVV